MGKLIPLLPVYYLLFAPAHGRRFFFVSFSPIPTPVKNIKKICSFLTIISENHFMLSLSSSLSISLILRFSCACLHDDGLWLFAEAAMESFALANGLRPAPPILVKSIPVPYPGRRIEAAFCFFGGDALKEALPQSNDMSNSFSLLLFLLSETYLPRSELWGRGESKKKSIVG